MLSQDKSAASVVTRCVCGRRSCTAGGPAEMNGKCILLKRQSRSGRSLTVLGANSYC